MADNGVGRMPGLSHVVHPLVGVEELYGTQLDAATQSKIFGRLGAGLLSVFKVSDRLVIDTKTDHAEALRLTVTIQRQEAAAGRRESHKPLKLVSTLSSSCRTRTGTTVAVFLGSKDDEKVDLRSQGVDTAAKVHKATRFYLRHPPDGVSILFEDENGKETRVNNLAFVGERVEPHWNFTGEGVDGCVAFERGTDATKLTVCQNGILVRENYTALLPPESIAVVGEINLTTTRLCRLKPSREEFMEKDDGFRRLQGRLGRRNRNADDRSIPEVAGEGRLHLLCEDVRGGAEEGAGKTAPSAKPSSRPDGPRLAGRGGGLQCLAQRLAGREVPPASRDREALSAA